MLELVNVAKNYDSPQGDVVAVLKDINLKVNAGQAVAVVGPSGSGKSTLLNIMGGLDRPSLGHVLLEGVDLAGLDDRSLAQVRNKQIGFVFQLHHLLPQCTVIENVLLPVLADGPVRPGCSAEKRAAELLDRVGLADKAGYRPGQLSGGQRQRVAVVRALINKPKLLLADEPTGSLDTHSAEQIGELLAELNRIEGVSLVVVTHSVALAERIGIVYELKDSILTDRKSSE